MKTVVKTVYNNPLQSAVKHLAYMNEVLNSLKQAADCRGILLLDGHVRQRVCGKLGIQKEDFDYIVQIACIYNLMKLNPRTKEAKIRF